MLLGLLGLLGVVGVLILRPTILSTYHYNQYVVAATHLALLGWIGSVVFGVLYQLVPVAIQMTLTMRGCPMHDSILSAVRAVLLNLPGVAGGRGRDRVGSASRRACSASDLAFVHLLCHAWRCRAWCGVSGIGISNTSDIGARLRPRRGLAALQRRPHRCFVPPLDPVSVGIGSALSWLLSAVAGRARVGRVQVLLRIHRTSSAGSPLAITLRGLEAVSTFVVTIRSDERHAHRTRIWACLGCFVLLTITALAQAAADVPAQRSAKPSAARGG